MQIQKIKGFADILYPQSALYAMVEDIARTLFSRYMYREIRTPMIEYTELFVRGIGASTDVVQKEMYTFEDKKSRSITLRPEATAGIVRAYIEHTIQGIARVFTIGPMFRYERPQKGRLRQFHQINCECIGAEEPLVDAEIIAMLLRFLSAIGITDITLLLNSLGCTECRPHYKEVLLTYLHSVAETLCPTCQARMENNPLRVLDCKEESCIRHLKNAPSITEYICTPCKEHFSEVQHTLDTLGISYTLTPRLVRGLDYYSRTTFEVVSNHIGAQSSIAGGGRYDTLIEEIGGKPTPAIGFACGMERLILLLQQPSSLKTPFYIASLCPEAKTQALLLAEELRTKGIGVEISSGVVSIKQCMKYAGKYAQYCILLGEDELLQGKCSIKNMTTGIQEMISFDSCVEYCIQQEIVSPDKVF